MDLCACESEERKHRVGAGANAIIMSGALYEIGLTVSAAARAKVWLRKKTMDLCACESEEREHGVGAGAK
jgi:hypothetical protein